jgi:hypothetical protein
MAFTAPPINVASLLDYCLDGSNRLSVSFAPSAGTCGGNRLSALTLIAHST